MKNGAMIKIRYFALPVLMIIFSAARAVKAISTEALTTIADSSIDNVAVACITIGVLCVAFTLKNKYWSGGVIFAGLAYVSRTVMMKIPEQKQISALTTLISCSVSAFLLVIAWRTVDTAIAQQGIRPLGKAAYAYLIAVLTIILGIFLYFGRG